MRKNNTAIIFGSLFFSCSVMAANGTLAPTVVPMVNGGQASIAISNTSPNLFTVPGDRIIAVNSLDGALTNNEQTASGGVVVATVNKKPFTFILETERGLNLSIQAVPREGAGRTIQLVSDLRGTGEEAGAWETSTPYESLLVTISQAVRGGKLPAGWYQVPVTKETLQAPAGLSSVADAVWTGNHLKMVRFTRNEGKQGPSLPYIPSGSFAKAMLIEGADANASVTGNESTVPMQLRITGLVEMPNSKTYDATGCFVGLEAWGDVSSERAIVRTRNISCLKDGKTIDMPIKGHVSFRGKNGIKGEVVMRNGKILGWAWGAGFVDGIGQGMERASQPAVGLGATAAYGAGDVLKMGIGGGASKAAQTLSDYYIKRAEQYHPVIPIGAGNEVTVVFQDGFQLKTVEEMALERTQSRAEEENQESPVPVPPSAESHLNGFNTDQMLKQLGNLNPQQFMSGSQGGGNDGK